jgi:hypothetical protein
MKNPLLRSDLFCPNYYVRSGNVCHHSPKLSRSEEFSNVSNNQQYPTYPKEERGSN